MEDNVYKKWEPLQGIPEKLYCEAIHDDCEGFRIILQGEKTGSGMIKILFNPAIAYRNIDESYLIKTLSRISSLEKSSLYIVENSKWTKWFHEESYDVYDDRKIIHYSIITPGDCIDILAEYSPNVEWLKCPLV